MNPSMMNAVMSMQGLQKKIDLISNNVANVGTTGYKKQEVTFYDVLTTTKRQLDDFGLEGRRSPLGLTEGWGTKLARTQLNMAQGSLKKTDLPLDLALEGNALFEISEIRRDNEGEPILDDNGDSELDRVWTRDGAFELSSLPNDPDNVYLTTKTGRLVRGLDNEPIAVPRQHAITIDANGNILAQNEIDIYAEPILVGQLKIVRVLRSQMLEKVGDQQFKVAGGVENIENVLEVLDLNQRDFDVDSIAVRQGFLEQSNVDLTVELTDLITAQRSLQFSARALSSSDQMMDITNRLRG